MQYDLDNMSIGEDDWAIKKKAAEVLVRLDIRPKPNHFIYIIEIESSRINEKVSVMYEVKLGAWPWSKKQRGGLQTDKDEFNRTMNMLPS